MRNGRVDPGERPHDYGFWPSYYERVVAQRQVAHVFVLGGDVEPKVRPLLREAGYTRIVSGRFAIWIPPGT